MMNTWFVSFSIGVHSVSGNIYQIQSANVLSYCIVAFRSWIAEVDENCLHTNTCIQRCFESHTIAAIDSPFYLSFISLIFTTLSPFSVSIFLYLSSYFYSLQICFPLLIYLLSYFMLSCSVSLSQSFCLFVSLFHFSFILSRSQYSTDFFSLSLFSCNYHYLFLV